MWWCPTCWCQLTATEEVGLNYGAWRVAEHWSSSSGVFLPIIAVFSVLGGAAAYLITLQEYRKHFPDRSEARRRAFVTGMVAVIVLFLLGTAALFFLSSASF